MVYCGNCGEDVTYVNDKYRCPFCGVEGNEPYMICPNCHVILNRNGRPWVCEHCDNEGYSKYSWP